MVPSVSSESNSERSLCVCQCERAEPWYRGIYGGFEANRGATSRPHIEASIEIASSVDAQASASRFRGCIEAGKSHRG